MTAVELIEKLKTVDPDMKVLIEDRDSTYEYYDADKMNDKHIHIGGERIVIVTE